MSGIWPAGYCFKDDSPETSGFHSILATEPEHPYMQGWSPGRAIGYACTFVNGVKDPLDGIAAGEGPTPPFGAAYRCRAVSEAVERSVGGRRRTRPEAYEQRAERES